MKEILLKNVNIIKTDKIINNGSVIIKDGKISEEKHA